MISDNTTQNIFRFIQLRGAITDDSDNPTLNGETPLARKLIIANDMEKKIIAAEFLREPMLSDLIKSDFSQQILARAQEVLLKDGDLSDVNDVDTNEQELQRIYNISSDILLATKIGNKLPDQYNQLETLFRITHALLNSKNSSAKLANYYRKSIALPKDLLSPRIGKSQGTKHKIKEQTYTNQNPDAISTEEIHNAKRELISRLSPEFLQIASDDNEVDSESVLSLNNKGMESLSEKTRKVLSKLGIQADKFSLDKTIHRLELEMNNAFINSPSIRTANSIPYDDTDEVRPYIKDVGVADLLVVKQHLEAYERVDIAHVENVLMGETKTRTHRALQRSEEIFTSEREVTQEKQSELETADRFELNKESSETVRRDQQIGFGLSLSGKYGPSVEFSSNLTANSTSATEESIKSATRYGKDVIARSLDRVIERVRTEQVRKLLREQEETNYHELKNESTEDHIRGVYQFLEKVYVSQVFNYGIRQMFDFMVPEPASYVWHIEKTEKILNLPPAPPSLSKEVPTAESITELNYLKLAALFGVIGVEPPPMTYVNGSTSFVAGTTGDEGGRPRSVTEKEFTIPAGYKPWRASVRISALTDDSITMAVGVGHRRSVWRPSSTEYVNVGNGNRIASTLINLTLFPVVQPYDPQNKLRLNVLAYETNTYTVAAEVTFVVMGEAYRAWQIKTYDKLLNAYTESLSKYELRIAELKAEAEAQAKNTNTKFGAPPSQNVKMVKTELKKHCISIVTRQRYEEFSAVQDGQNGEPPFFEFPKAAEQGSFTRFFEQAFEWDQMQYVFYPYFWSRKDFRAPMFIRSETDSGFLEFLQAGSARVVVPVRPGFELALTHYLETGEIWDGTGEPPDINDPLYVPIITEIQERTGASQGEFPVGDPWKTRVPTPLVILRGSNEKLPEWERPDPTNWEWQEVPDQS